MSARPCSDAVRNAAASHTMRIADRPGDDAAVRQDGDAQDLRPSRRRRAIDALCRRRRKTRSVACARASGGTVRSTRSTPPHAGHPARTRRGRSTARRRTRPAPVAASTSNRRVVSTGRRRRAQFVCPVSVPRHRPLDGSHTLSVLSLDPDTTRPFDRTVTHLTCAPRGVDEQSTRCVDWTPAPRPVRVPGQRLAAPPARRVPHTGTVVQPLALTRRGRSTGRRRNRPAPVAASTERSTRGSKRRRRRAVSPCAQSLLSGTINCSTSIPDLERVVARP